MRLTYDVDVEDLVVFDRRRRAMWRRDPLKVLGVGAVALLLVFIVAYTIALEGPPPVTWLVVFVAVLILGSGFDRWSAARRIGKMYREGRGGVVGRQSMRLEGDKLVVESAAGRAELAVALIDDVERMPGFLVVYGAPKVGHVVPRRAVVEGDFDEFAGAVEQAVMSARSPPAD